MTIGGSRATMIPDIQGSILATLDSGTGTFMRQNYLPYGKSASAAITGTFGFTGQRIDPETNGLYYYRARMYHPTWGRFMQPDPLGTLTDNLQGSVTGTGNRTNLYVYANNDPLNNTDPTGLLTLTLGLGYSFYAGAGGELSFGLALSFPVPYFDPNSNFDVGSYFSPGGGVGANVGSAVSGGLYSGDILNGGLRGALVNTGAGVGPFGAQASFAPNTGQFVGGALSFGPRAPIPVFGSTSITDTSVSSLRSGITNLIQSLTGGGK